MPSLQARAALVNFQAVNPATGATGGGSGRVDTGADISLIDTSVLTQIGATPTGSIQVIGIDGNPETMSLYTINLNFGQYGYIQNAVVAGDQSLLNSDGYQMLVGTDLLSTGMFDYDGSSNDFTIQVGVGQGPAFSLVPTWLLPTGFIAVSLGLAGLLWGATR